MEQENKKMQKEFCSAYLQTMDPEIAARRAGCPDGLALLGTKPIQTRLEKLRETAGGQIRQADVIRRLARLAFGQTNDAITLALHPGQADPKELDLFAVSECKVTEKGVELKFIDRIRALEALSGLLAGSGEETASELYKALTEAVEEGGWEHD